MRITWYGHAAFLVEADGKRIILDPYTSADVGSYAPISEGADVVAASHENAKYHSGTSEIVPPFETVLGTSIPPEGVEVAGIRIQAIPAFETPEKRAGDEVSILDFRLEGLHVAFLGDLGHPLGTLELALLGRPDVLLVPAGGPPTIDYPLIPPLIDALSPSIVIPMHYLTPKINLEIQPVERFLEALPDWPVERVDGPSVTVDRESLEPRRIVVLESAR
ncbi:MBL fold metallo-hydrolase [Tautonia plasticadhaerens]|uniref:Metal-dependent hydrolase n=1 Tax=Tautonia plasticadhaerens TaxID=2527974 RepID=A0A518H6Y1_9BACT|nr:MBL fold metallo-hydrolase [Tautonia plasticadhaerens]QDV36516.1 metal-dependent hydrolase [Tautonia plasticadhaerens]